MKQRRICLITPSHPCSNPRMLKEADALAEAGYSVHVISCRYMPALDAFDREIYKNAKWSYTVVDQTGGIKRIKYGLLRKIARLHPETVRKIPLLAHHAAARDMLKPALAHRADLYLGHVLAGLPIAVAAAKHNNAIAGFDAEDFHSKEISESSGNTADLLARHKLERLIRYCKHRTASSPEIAAAYLESYGISMQSILNVFPLSIGPSHAIAGTILGAGKPLRFYWFSQTVGPARGIEEAANMLSQLSMPWQLDLRGWCEDSYKAQLHKMYGDRIRILPPAPPDDMVKLAAEYDAGLSLELTTPKNRDLCLTNKIFTYLLAGIPVILSKTTAQCALAAELGNAAIVIDLHDGETSARKLESFLGDASKRQASRDHAWHLGQTRFNWDMEKEKFLRLVEHSLAS